MSASKRKRFVIDSEDEGRGFPAEPKSDAASEEEGDEEDWQFDCVCGVTGTNIDDGTEMAQCGKPDCGLWFHSACVAVQDEAGRSFLPRVCWRCQQIKLEDSELAARIAFLEYQYSMSEAAPAANRRRGRPANLKSAPVAVEHNAACQVCAMGGELLCCDHCNLVYHLECLDPPLDNIPEGVWACPECERAGL